MRAMSQEQNQAQETKRAEIMAAWKGGHIEGDEAKARLKAEGLE